MARGLKRERSEGPSTESSLATSSYKSKASNGVRSGAAKPSADVSRKIQRTSNAPSEQSRTAGPSRGTSEVTNDSEADGQDHDDGRDGSPAEEELDELERSNDPPLGRKTAGKGKNIENGQSSAADAGEDVHDDDDEEDESDSSSVENEELARNGVGRDRGQTARRGVIARLDLINFMCHDKLAVQFGPRLNFVIGHNGSGKSAILTGITLGLGAKASTTSRGSNVRDFIKNGKPYAVVTVVLTNRGEDGYKREMYGDEIVIERIIRQTAESSSTWRIMAQNGKLVSTQRRELDAITDHYNIQVDNPINVLTQDQSRSFLTSANPSELYEFFLRGTQLQQLRLEYKQIENEHKRASTILHGKRAGLASLQRKRDEAVEKYEVLQAAQSQRFRLESLKVEAAWAYVQEREKEVEDAAFRHERVNLQRDKLLREIEDEQSKEAAATQRLLALETKAHVANEREEPIQDELAKAQSDIKSLQAGKKDLETQEMQLNQNYRTCKDQIRDVDRKMEETVENERDGNKEIKAIHEKRKQKEIECRKIEGHISAARDRSDAIEADIEATTRERDQLERKRDEQRDRIASLDSLIRQLKAAKANHLTAYGQHMPVLVQKIETIRKNGGWRGPVVGPIGSMIKLKDPKWAPVLESVIGNTLSAFCVTNHADRMLLQRLKREARCDEVSILTGSDEEFDYSAGEPDKELLTILRVLDIPNGFVRRSLINAANIERSVLVQQRHLGDKIFRERRRNVKVCFSSDLFRLSGGEGGNSTQTLQRYTGPPRLSTDVDSQLAEASASLPDEEAKLQKIMDEHKDVVRQIGEWQDEVRQIRHQIQGWTRELQEARKEIRRLFDEGREKQPESMPALELAKKELEGELEHFESQFRRVEEQISAQEERLAERKDKRDTLKNQLLIMREESKTIRPELESVAAERHTAIIAIQHKRRQEEDLIPRLEELQARFRVLEKGVKDDEKRAVQIGERVETDKSSEDLEKEIDAITIQLRLAHEASGDDDGSISRSAEQAIQRYDKAEAEVEELNHALDRLDVELDERHKKWDQFRGHMSVKARNMFAYYMQTRGFEGRLKFKHISEKLLLHVKTDPGLATSIRKDTRSLSGGERSFSTICLLLSLWDAIGCPIRALDEFDVFMDAVNRRISMKLVANAARLAHNTQFILITPLNIDGVDLGADVNILRLSDPERG